MFDHTSESSKHLLQVGNYFQECTLSLKLNCKFTAKAGPSRHWLLTWQLPGSQSDLMEFLLIFLVPAKCNQFRNRSRCFFAIKQGENIRKLLKIGFSKFQWLFFYHVVHTLRMVSSSKEDRDFIVLSCCR